MSNQNHPVPSYNENLQTLVTQLNEMMPADKMAIFTNDALQLATTHTSPLKITAGDTAPTFSLPDQHKNTVNLSALLQQGPVVLTFYRGVWCPYCNLQLKNYQEILPQIHAAGASLVAISPMTPDNSLSTKEQNELQFSVLSDTGNHVARQYTTVFKNSQAAVNAMSDLGYDFHSFYDDESGEIPVAATFVIDTDGTLLMATSAGGDYRERVEPQDILDALATQKKSAQ
ncbi:MAG: AhpC/TSA family protein [Ectothiorhodospiraceae bacterium]|nr:AhpC/TSA family protein [Ectothiorhodospiraceae bacterium]